MDRPQLIMHAVGAAVFFAMGAACTNTVSVRVEKLAGVSRSLPVHADADALLAETRDALAGLVDLCIECRAACAPDDFECTLPVLAAARDKAAALLRVADELTGSRARSPNAEPGFSAQVAALRRRARAILPDSSSAAFAELVAMETDAARRSALTAMARRSELELARLSTALDAPTAGDPGFGGFRPAGVYLINPGDPMYDAVLAARPSPRAITAVEVRADGDAGVMIVQESPGQMRLYQLTSDPLTLMRNVSLILEKALQGVVKFSAPAGG